MSSHDDDVTLDSIKISCKTCCKTIAKTRRFISCQQCDSKFHIKCFNTESSASKTTKSQGINELCSQCNQKNKKCGRCTKVIGTNHRYINCSNCFGKFHIKCNETDENTYNQ